MENLYSHVCNTTKIYEYIGLVAFLAISLSLFFILY